MNIKHWFLLSATFVFPLSAQTASEAGEDNLGPVGVEVSQSRVAQQGSQVEVNESVTWWVTVDESTHAATIVAPPSTGKYEFGFAGRQSSNAIAEYGMYLWNTAIAGLPGESLFFSAVRLPETVTVNNTEYSVTAIGDRAFAGSNIAFLHVPSTVTNIGDYAFEGATSLVGVDVASGYELVPNSVTGLGRGAFKGCTSLKRIDIGDGVTELKEETLDGCTSLTQISLGAGIEKISCSLPGEVAFHSPTAPSVDDAELAAVSKVWYPEEYGSEYTTAFNGVTLSPFSVASTDGNELRFYKDQPRTVSFEINSAQWIPAGNNTLYYFLYPSHAGSVADDSQIEPQTEIAEGMTILMSQSNNESVPKTHVPFRLLFDDNSAVSISDYNNGPQATATSVTLTYTTPGQYKLTVMANDLTHAAHTWDVEVVDGFTPERVEISGKSYMAVNSRQQLTAKVFGADDNEAYDQRVRWSVSDETIASIDDNGNLQTLKDGEVLVTATTIDSGSEPREATFTIYVVETINEDVTVVEVSQIHRTGQDNSAMVNERFAWWVSKDALNKTATIIAPQTSSGKYHFDYPGLASQDSPTAASKNFWTPSLAGFYGEDTHFTAVRIPATVTIDGEEYTIKAIGERAFAESNIAYLHVPSTVESIGDYAFEKATYLAGIGVASAYELVPNSVTSLGKGVFKGCSSLTRIDIGDGVTEIKEETFDGCTALKQISIGSSVEKISCSLEGFNAIAFHSAAPPQVSSLSTTTLWVPQEHEADYASAFTGANIETFSVTPVQESLKFYTNIPHAIKFDIKSAQWIPDGDNSRYYFIYEALRYSQLAPAHKANGILVASDPNNPDDITHVGYRLYFSDNNVATINDSYVTPHATESSVYVRYDTPGTYQLTIVANDVTHASYTWNVEVVEGNPVEYISISGPAAIGIDNTAQLRANVSGVDKNQPVSVTDLIWSVSDEEIATVDQTGLVTAKSLGEVRIFAKSADPATPDIVGGFIINITRGEALKFTSKQLVAQNQTIYDANSDKWGTVTNSKSRETDLWYFANEDGSMTLTYPEASLDDANDGQSIADIVAKNHYTFDYPGFTAIALSQQNKIMYGAGMESYMLSYDEGAAGFMTAFDLPLSINRALNDGSGVPVADMKPVKKIGNYAFAYSNITVLNIGEIAAEQAFGESLTEIGDYAFYDCTEFLGVPEGTAYEVVPDCVTKLGRNVFDGCRKMERMIIGNGVEEIPVMAFHDCQSLKELHLGKNVKLINCDIYAKNRLVFGSTEPPVIGEGYKVVSPEIWVPKGSEETYIKAGYDATEIRPYYLEVNGGEDICASVGLKRTSAVSLTAANLSCEPSQHYLYAYQSGESGQWSINVNQAESDRPRYEVESRGVNSIFPFNNRLELRYAEGGDYELKFRSLDITNQIVKVKVHVTSKRPVTNININGPANHRIEHNHRYTFKATHNGESDPEFRWLSSNPEVVEIDPVTGVAIAKSYGSATITVFTNNKYYDQVSTTFNVDVHPEGMASVYQGTQRRPASQTILGGRLDTELTTIRWWYHIEDTPESQAGDKTAAITFPESTPADEQMLSKGKLQASNCYDFEWSGWESIAQSGYGAYAWHSGMPKGLEPNFFSAIKVPEIVTMGDEVYAVTAIAPGAFAGSNAQMIHVHDGIETIGDYAFAYCDYIEGLSLSGDYDYIPSSVKTIGKGLFKESKNLRQMRIGDGVEDVPAETFDGCQNLRWVGFGEKIKRINCNIAQSKYVGTGDERHLEFSELEYISFRSKEPPIIPSNLTVKTKMIYVPKGSGEAYRQAWSGRFAGIISEYSIDIESSNIQSYSMQDVKVNFTKRTAISGATTFYFMYPCDHKPGLTNLFDIYSFTVSGATGYAARGVWYLMFFEDEFGNRLDHESLWSANRVTDNYAILTFSKPGKYRFIIEAYDGTRCQASTMIEVKEGNPVEKITIDGYPGVNIGSEIQLTANLIGPTDPADSKKNLEPTVKTVTWISTNPSVATVDQNGKVTGIKEGNTTIYARSADPCCTDVYATKRIHVGDKFNDMVIHRVNYQTGQTEMTFEPQYGIFGYPGDIFRVKEEGFPYGIEGASFVWEMTTQVGQTDIFSLSSTDKLMRLVKPGRSTLKVTIPASQAEGDKDIEFLWPVIVKTEMKQIEVTKPVDPAEDDDANNNSGDVKPGGEEPGVTIGGNEPNNDELITDDNPLSGLNGDKVDVNVTIDPDATNRYVDFESSDPSIAEVISITRNDETPVPSGMTANSTIIKTPDCTATLVLKKKGRAIITALDPDRRGATYSFPVDVRQRAESIRLFNPESGEEISERQMIASHPRTAIAPRAEILPLEADINDAPASQQVRYRSVDPGKITDNGDGTLTVNDTGFIEVVATVADGSKTEVRFTIHSTALAVEELLLATDTNELKVGEKATIAAKFMPTNATDQRLLWSTSNRKVLSVSEGVVTAVAPGTATITATSLSNKTIFATLSITVVNPNDSESSENPGGDDSDNPDNSGDDSDEHGGTTDIDAIDVDNITVSTEGDEIIVEGAPQGMVVSVYNVSGSLVYRSQSNGNTMHIAVRSRGVYIIIAGKIFKLSV